MSDSRAVAESIAYLPAPRDDISAFLLLSPSIRRLYSCPYGFVGMTEKRICPQIIADAKSMTQILILPKYSRNRARSQNESLSSYNALSHLRDDANMSHWPILQNGIKTTFVSRLRCQKLIWVFLKIFPRPSHRLFEPTESIVEWLSLELADFRSRLSGIHFYVPFVLIISPVHYIILHSDAVGIHFCSESSNKMNLIESDGNPHTKRAKEVEPHSLHLFVSKDVMLFVAANLFLRTIGLYK